MSFILSGAGVITDPANAPIDVTRNSAGPYLPGVAYTWNITNLDDYTTYTLTTTNGTIVRSSATLTYTPASSGAGGWTMNGRAINLTIASISAFISTSVVSSTVFNTGANSANSTYSMGGWYANTGVGPTGSAVVAQYAPTGVRNWIRVLWDGVSGTANFACFGVKLASDNSSFISMHDATNNRAYFIRLDTSGNTTWSKYLQNFQALPGSIAVDSSDSLIIGGYSGGGLTTIAKYNSAGTQQWQLVSGAFSDYVYGITTDSSNNIYFVTGNNVDCKIVKLNSAGAVQWTTRLTNTSIYGQGIALDSAGNIYAVGYYTVGSNYGFVCKLNASGVLQWQRQVLNQQFYGCAVDSSDNVYVSGEDAGGGLTGYYSAMKWNSSGAFQWQRTIYYGNTNNSVNYVSVSGSSFYLTNSGYNGGYGFLLGQNRLPTDGSIPTFSIGFSPGTYAASSYTESAGTMTNPAGSMTLAAGALAETTLSPTNQALTSAVNVAQGV